MLVSSPEFTLNINDLAFCSKISLLLNTNEKTYFLWQMVINTTTSTDEGSENKSLECSALNTLLLPKLRYHCGRGHGKVVRCQGYV